MEVEPRERLGAAPAMPTGQDVAARLVKA